MRRPGKQPEVPFGAAFVARRTGACMSGFDSTTERSPGYRGLFAAPGPGRCPTNGQSRTEFPEARPGSTGKPKMSVRS